MRVEAAPGHAQIAADQPQLDVAAAASSPRGPDRRAPRACSAGSRVPCSSVPVKTRVSVGAERQGRDIHVALLVVGVEAVRQHDRRRAVQLGQVAGDGVGDRDEARRACERPAFEPAFEPAQRRHATPCRPLRPRITQVGQPGNPEPPRQPGRQQCVVAGGDVLMMASAPDSRASRSIVGSSKSQGHASSGNDTSC